MRLCKLAGVGKCLAEVSRAIDAIEDHSFVDFDSAAHRGQRSILTVHCRI